MPRAESGFTLLEVVFALAIAVLGIAAVAGATGGAAEVADATRERTLAVWVAGNRLSELRITRAWPAPGSYDLVRSMGGRTWHLTETVSPTSSEELRRVDVAVYTDAGRDTREYQAFGYIARYREPEARVEDTQGLDDEDQPVDEGGGAPPAEDGAGAQ
ncbi:MAG TPA: type II secretion system minor pseudopilin GspI [Arenicellales bacterium]|nr:type II secretion system minor pseudopilin GspI [Arenicellales bacterium]